MKRGKQLFFGILSVFLVLFLILGAGDANAARKRKKTSLTAKVQEVEADSSFMKAPDYDRVYLLTYKKKHYLNIKELAYLLSDTDLRFDVKVNKNSVNFKLDKKFKSKNFWMQEFYNKKVKFKFSDLKITIAGKKYKTKAMIPVGVKKGNIYLDIDFLSDKLDFEIKKQGKKLLIGHRIMPQIADFEMNLLSSGKSKKSKVLSFRKKQYVFIEDMAKFLDGSAAGFAYKTNLKEALLELHHYKTFTPDSDFKNKLKAGKIDTKKITLLSDDYGKEEVNRTAFDPKDVKAELEMEYQDCVVTEALVFDGKLLLNLDFFSAVMGCDKRVDGSTIIFDDKKIMNRRILKYVQENGNQMTDSYSRWGELKKDYLYEENGELVFVGAADSSTQRETGLVNVQRYSKAYKLLSEMTVNYEGDKFGGFFRGSTYNFIMYGNNNPEHSDDKITYTLVKYDRDFNKLASLDIRGAYTAVPFDAGSLSMAEHGESLVIHTAKTRYDGHQSQMSFIVDTGSMTLMNMDDIGEFQKNHVSHSFNQIVEIDENKRVYFLDHGDAYPRSLVLTKMSIMDGKLVFLNGDRRDSGNQFDIMSFPGETGANQTGFSLGNMVQGSRNLLIGGNHIDYSKATGFDSYDIFGTDVHRRDAVFFVVNKENTDNPMKIMLSDYSKEGADTTYSVAKIVKLNDDKYMVLWNKYAVSKVKGEEKMKTSLLYTYVNQDGAFLSETKEIEGMELSEEEPVVIDGKLMWVGIHSYSYDESNSQKALNILPVE